MKKIILLTFLVPGTLFTIAQNVGIGTTNPIARFHVADSNVLFTGPNPFVNYNPPQLPPMQDAGTRMMWYPQKGAFRAGWVEDNRWNKDSIGIFSMAFGHSTLASYTGSTAFGVRSNARGTASTGFGWGSSANTDYSIAGGYFSRAEAPNAVALGTENLASGMFSTSIGIHTVSSGNSAFAIGDSSIASGTQSVAAGAYVAAKARASFSAGGLNDNTDNPDPVFSSPADRIFQIGNGDAFLGTRSNALTILRNANTGIGITNPRFPLSFNNSNGDKISLYDDGNPAQLHFGLGIFSNSVMQLHSATLFDDIAFGYGNSNSFTERMRIKGNGKVGINTSTPLACLHVADSSVVFTGAAILPASPGNPPISGSGTRMMWYPDKAAFRAGNTTGTQWDKDNTGNYSFASGSGNISSGNSATATGASNTASGDYSFASGIGSKATGLVSTAMGSNTTASGPVSTAMGDNTIASGFFSTVMGRYTKAKSDFSLVTGIYNDTTAINRLFEIGNGTADNARKNALTVLQNGKVGVNTTTPLANLHVADSNVVFTGQPTFPSGPGSPPVSGAGTRMMWYADKAAFRSGYIDGTQWNKDNVGNLSFATGVNTTASGFNSVAMGNQSVASGLSSIAIGNANIASGNFSVALGGETAIASASYSTAMGRLTTASGIYSTAMGVSTTASALASTAMGDYTIAKSDRSLVIGLYNDTTATNRLFEIGSGTAFNARANAMTVLRNGNVGIGATNPLKQTEIIGAASAAPVTLVIGNRGGFGPAAMEFVSDYGLVNQWRPGYIKSNDIGGFTGSLEFYTNGTGAGNLYGNVKGFEVRNGAALTATGAVGTFSDERLKKNITAFTDGLNVIGKINPVQFQYNELSPFKTDELQIGILAQQLEKLAPYMVHHTKEKNIDDLRWVNNQAYIFLLINAVKELSEQNKEMQKQIDQLKTTK